MGPSVDPGLSGSRSVAEEAAGTHGEASGRADHRCGGLRVRYGYIIANGFGPTAAVGVTTS